MRQNSLCSVRSVDRIADALAFSGRVQNGVPSYGAGVLELQGVTKSYGGIRALDGVSLEVEPGEILALVGENGAGKSTLVRCIAGAESQDGGTITIRGEEVGRTPRGAMRQGISVVWQDLALCENLDVAANLFLGREIVSGVGLQRSTMHSAAMTVFADLGVEVPDLTRPIQRLSGGQRQLVAIARATLDRPDVLILDEPTAALGVTESRTVRNVIRSLQAKGVAIILVSHQLDEVFDLAGRILVLRHGQTSAVLDRAETHPDDVIALIAGVDADTTAGQQLSRLHSLSEQLAEADASSVLPLTVSSLSDALSCDRLAVFLADRAAPNPVYRLTAALNLSASFEAGLRAAVFEPGEGFVEEAAGAERIVLIRDVAHRPFDEVAELAHADGLAGAWAAPIVGQGGTMAVIVGFTDLPAGFQPEQQQLLELFSTMAGAAIDRGQLVESLRINVQSLEGLQGVLEVFASEEDPGESLVAALGALRDGIGAETTALQMTEDGVTTVLTSTPGSKAAPVGVGANPSSQSDFRWSRGTGQLRAWWGSDDRRSEDSAPVLQGAANSFRLALERGLVREAHQESSNLRVSRALERNLTRRLGHELRTPLTAIQGFASTLMQSDIEWADADRRRFTELIEVESERLSRLVDALFDTASLEAGTFLANVDYCNVSVAARRAADLAGRDSVTLDLPESLVVWGDGDRLEQVFINLITNALRHNPPGTSVTISVGESTRTSGVRIVVSDDGGGLPPDVLDFLNGRRADLGPDRGLGTRLVRGFVVAQNGEVSASSSAPGASISIELPTEPEET